MTIVAMPKPVAYMVDWPDDPANGRHFSDKEEKCGRCRPVITTDQAEAYAAEKVREAIWAAADVIKKKWVDYDDECGSTDPDTGAREYPGEGADYVCEMQELEDEIRALIPQHNNEQESRVETRRMQAPKA